jgi:hypothetical protein
MGLVCTVIILLASSRGEELLDSTDCEVEERSGMDRHRRAGFFLYRTSCVPSLMSSRSVHRNVGSDNLRQWQALYAGVDLGQGGLKQNTVVGREWEVSCTVVPTIFPFPQYNWAPVILSGSLFSEINYIKGLLQLRLDIPAGLFRMFSLQSLCLTN